MAHISKPKEHRGDCPVCGYANAYAETVTRDGKRLGWCASCQDKDAIAAYLRGSGESARRAVGMSASIAQDRAEKAAKARERARIIWDGAEIVTAHDPAGKYLTSRGLAVLIGFPFLRYRADCPHPDGKRYPAMIAPLLSMDGQLQGVHRTFLTLAGKKANLEPVKASLGSMWGSSIWVRPAAEQAAWQETIVAEGIESAASAAILLDLPAIAAVSAGNMASGLALPPFIKSVVIAADDDGINAQGHNPGIEAAEAAARRWQAEGRAVRIIKPTQPGQDFNDVLMQRNREMN